MKRFLVVALFASTVCGKSVTVQGKIEPIAVVTENESFTENGKSSFTLRRAQISFKIGHRIATYETIGELTLDASEKEFDAMIHDGWVGVRFSDHLTISAGRSKIPFGHNATIGSSKLPTIYRSWTADHLEEDLGVSGYGEGVRATGSFLDKRVRYTVALNRSIGDQRDGYSMDRMVSYPLISIGGSPVPWLDLRWDMAFPRTAVTTEQGVRESIRPVIHDWSIICRTPRLYTGSLELFLGPDTAEGRTLTALSESYDENISFSLYTLHELSIPVTEEITILPAAALEYCNGLNRNAGAYVNRDFYWAPSAAIGAKLGKNFALRFSADDRFDESFQSTHNLRLAAQATLTGSLSSKEEAE